MHDRELLDLLEAIEAQPLSGTVWRVAWASREPLTGGTAGGRWHQPSSFEALYTSQAADGALAEMYFHLSRAPVFASSHMRLFRLRIRTARTLWLTDMKTLVRLGIDKSRYASLDHGRSQEIGAAAHFLEFDSLLVPSARWPCQNLILFLDRLNPEEALAVDGIDEINWPAMAGTGAADFITDTSPPAAITPWRWDALACRRASGARRGRLPPARA